jgi:hypothetical protein
MKKELFRILLSPDVAEGAAQEKQSKSKRPRLDRMNNTELEKALHECTEYLRDHSDDEDAKEAVAEVEALLLKPKQTIKAKAKVAVVIDGKLINKDQEVMLTPQQFGAHAINLARAACVAFIAALCLLAIPAKAQQYGTIATLVNGGVVTTGNDAGASIRSNYTAVAVTKYQEIYIDVQAYGSNTTTGNWFIPYAFSSDGTNVATAGAASTNAITVPCAAAGARMSFQTNIYVGSAGYFHTGIIGATNTTFTNVTYKIIAKPNRFGN